MDLISVLILTYSVSGHIHESEINMAHAACMAAQAAITTALKGPRKDRPTVELHSGARVPVDSVTCLPACMTDGLDALELLAMKEDA